MKNPYFKGLIWIKGRLYFLIGKEENSFTFYLFRNNCSSKMYVLSTKRINVFLMIFIYELQSIQ